VRGKSGSDSRLATQTHAGRPRATFLRTIQIYRGDLKNLILKYRDSQVSICIHEHRLELSEHR
jgi:hypothetical protein